MANISRTWFSNACAWMKMVEFSLRFDPMAVQLTDTRVCHSDSIITVVRCVYKFDKCAAAMIRWIVFIWRSIWRVGPVMTAQLAYVIHCIRLLSAAQCCLTLLGTIHSIRFISFHFAALRCTYNTLEASISFFYSTQLPCKWCNGYDDCATLLFWL